MPARGQKPKVATRQPKPQKASNISKVATNVDNRAAAAKPKPRPKAKPANDPGVKEAKVPVEQLLKEECDNKDIVDEFICGICLVHVVGCSPKLTSCSHLFCGDCMEQWFASHQTNQTWAQRAQTAGSERTAPCPVCKHQLHEGESLFPVSSSGTPESAMLWQMLTSLKVCCANHVSVRPDGKCNWTGWYGSYNKHLSSCENETFQAYSTFDGDTSEQFVRQATPPLHWDGTSDGVDTSSLANGSEKAVSEQCATESTEASLGIDEPIAEESDETGSQGDLGEASVAESDEAEVPGELEEAVATESCEVEKPGELEKPTATKSDEADMPAEVEDAVATEAQEAELPCKPEEPAPTDSSVEESRSTPQNVHGDTEKRVDSAGPRSEQFVMGDLMESIKALVELKLQGTDCSEVPAVPSPEPATSPPQQSSPEIKAEVRKVKVVHAFSAAADTQLSLQEGELLEIDEQHSSGWTYGRKSHEGQASKGGPVEGWFPQWAISP